MAENGAESSNDGVVGDARGSEKGMHLEQEDVNV